MDSFGDCAPPSQLPRLIKLVAFEPKKTTVGSGGFFFVKSTEIPLQHQLTF